MILRKNTLLLFLFFFGKIFSANSQSSEDVLVTQERFESKYNKKEQSQTITFDSKKILVLSTPKKAKAFQKFREYKYEYYDSRFNAISTEVVQISKNQINLGDYRSNYGLHSMFLNRINEFTILTFDKESGNILKCEGILPNYSSIYRVISNSEFLFLMVKIDGELFLVNIDWKTGKFEQTPIKFEESNSAEFYAITFENILGSEEIQLSGYFVNNKKEKETITIFFNKSGNLFQTVRIGYEENLFFNTISMCKTDDNTYTFLASILTSSKNSTQLGESIYFGQISDDYQRIGKIHSFSSLSNFFGYLTQEELEDLLEKREKNAEKTENAEKRSLINIETHPIIECGNDFLFLGEVYEEKWIKLVKNANGITYKEDYYVGKEYSHAVLICFDKKGDIKWDQVMKLNPGFKGEVNKIGNKNSNTINLVYLSNSNVVSMSFNSAGKVVREMTIKPLETLDETDKIKKTTSIIHYWYDNCFLITGVQKIKNKKHKREGPIYFYNKIHY